jgi:four helix bundle protein
MKQIRRFGDLEVFQLAYRVSLEIHRLTLELPREEQCGLADQMRKASKSICANVAEGFGKQNISKAEFKRFVLIAMGSADEMRVWLRYCLDLDYIDETRWKKWSEDYQRIAKMLNSLHTSWK